MVIATSTKKPVKKPSRVGPSIGQGPVILESVGIVFDILDRLSRTRRPMGVTELALTMGQPKPRIYRHLASMRQIGVVEQEPLSEKYRLGARLVSYGSAANNQFDLRTLADPYLTKLRDATGETAVLSVAAQETALVVASVESNNPVCISVKPGNRVPIHCSAQGRIVLAWCDEATQHKLLKHKLERFTDKSVTDTAEIHKRLARIRERLYEDANGEVFDGVNVLAAPIFSAGNDLVGIIGIVGAARNIPSPPKAEQLKAVQGVAAAISTHLAGTVYETLKNKRARG